VSRTTAAAVRDVLLRDYDSIDCPRLQPFVDKASIMTDDVLTCSTRKGSPYSTAKLEMIERFLAAHAYAMSDRTYKSRSTLRASGTFNGQTGMYLEATPYGQEAKELDNLGCLEAVGKTKTVGAVWLGRRPSQQTDVDDRS